MMRKVKTRFIEIHAIVVKKLLVSLTYHKKGCNTYELGLKPLKFQKVQELTDRQKKVRLERTKELLRLYESGQLPNLGFSDGKPFQIEQFVNK